MGSGKTIEEAPSWVVVNMLLAFLVVSVFIEHLMEWIHDLLEKRHSDGLFCDIIFNLAASSLLGESCAEIINSLAFTL